MNNLLKSFVVKRTQFVLIALFLFSVFFNYCATIVRGTSQELAVNSTPSNARIIVNGEDKGKTPSTLTLKRSKTYQIVFKLDGYEDLTVNIDKNFKFVPTIIGNIFSWGIIGIVVDLANGSAYQLSPEQVNVTLASMGTSLNLPKNGNENELNVVFFTTEDLKRANK